MPRDWSTTDAQIDNGSACGNVPSVFSPVFYEWNSPDLDWGETPSNDAWEGVTIESISLFVCPVAAFQKLDPLLWIPLLDLRSPPVCSALTGWVELLQQSAHLAPFSVLKRQSKAITIRSNPECFSDCPQSKAEWFCMIECVCLFLYEYILYLDCCRTVFFVVFFCCTIFKSETCPDVKTQGVLSVTRM